MAMKPMILNIKGVSTRLLGKMSLIWFSLTSSLLSGIDWMKTFSSSRYSQRRTRPHMSIDNVSQYRLLIFIKGHSDRRRFE
jgi:hypothetical protein